MASVIATGPGIYEDGKFRETLVKAGDKVLLPSYGGMEIEIDDVKYNIYRDTEIVGTVE